jgi:hypothetical protein
MPFDECEVVEVQLNQVRLDETIQLTPLLGVKEIKARYAGELLRQDRTAGGVNVIDDSEPGIKH